jgi:phospholipid transport system substrate-binding protein
MRDIASAANSFANLMNPVRRAVLIGLVALLPASTLFQSAQAATPAEAYVSENIQKGLQILKQANSAQRTTQFQTFLEGLTDIGRIAKFTLGAARRTATPADIDAFDGAFKNYVIAVYQSRLSQYSGQTLKITGSNEHQPGDFIVSTVMIDPNDHSGQQPLEVDFRVLSDNGRLVVIDVSVAGVWLAIEERDQFSAFLGQHNGSIPALVTHLNTLTEQLKAGNSR